MRSGVLNYKKREVVDLVVHNVAGATIGKGEPACFTTTAASLGANQVVSPAAGVVKLFAGVALKDIPDNKVGVVRAYGQVDSVKIYAHGTSVTTGAGVAIGPGGASAGFSSTGLVNAFGPVVALAAIGAAVNSPGGYAKGFVRALG